ncbi:MAG: sigma 54-interacting transcriptional regulator [bacterium]
MKAKDLKFSELFDISDGKIELKGRRLVIHSMNAFAHLRKELIDNVGKDQARRIFTRFGYFWGQADAAAMKRIFKWDTFEEWMRAGMRLHAMQGIVKPVVETLEVSEKAGFYNAAVIWRDSGEAEEHISELGKSRGHDTACWMLVGYASGYASFCMDTNVYFIEKTCVASGEKTCYAIGKDEKSWGEEIKPYLPYFQAEDIKGKIQKLTKELMEKSKLLSTQTEKLASLESKGKDALFIEVHSKAYRTALELASRVANFDSLVLITGETGTGKEIMARFIHRNSQRAAGPFVGINCGALPETLLESELFGHKAGSFTGATDNRIGLFETAENGTVFLDEIGDITPAMQLKLLRVLQEKEIMRVGESKTRKINTRVLAATNKNLTKMVSEGKFREDLLYRIKIIEIEIPALRKRREDILPLARFFIKKLSKKLNLPTLKLDSTCVDHLNTYPWPGNVRELENVLESAAVMTPDGVIKPEYLPLSITNPDIIKSQTQNPLNVSLDQLEKTHITTVLKLCGGNKTKAAKSLGISQATLWRKLGGN